MRVVVETVLPMAVQGVVARLRTPELLCFVAAPLVRFEPLDPPQFPSEWAEGKYLVAARLFGLIPLGRQTVDISFDGVSEDCYAIRDNGHGDLARRWDHRIDVVDVGSGQTRYRDTIDIEAGILTPFVWLFAQLFYRHRQRRWQQLTRTLNSPLTPLTVAVHGALASAQTAALSGNTAAAWAALERAHVLSQPVLRPHLQVHRAMLRLAIATRDTREVAGQAVRLALAPLGNLTGRIPWGNNGRANVSAFAPAPLPDDVATLYRAAGVEVRR